MIKLLLGASSTTWTSTTTLELKKCLELCRRRCRARSESDQYKAHKPLKEEDLSRRVTRTRIDRKDTGLWLMKVKLAKEEEEREYVTVFATPTLACFRRMDLTELELLYE